MNSPTHSDPDATDATDGPLGSPEGDSRVAGVPGDQGAAVAAELTRTLAVLGASSVLGGGILALASGRPARREFGRQSASWGAINLAIAGVGAWRSRSTPAQASRLRRTLLINAGLDVGYVAAGAHIAHHRSTFRGRLSPEQARGGGLAVLTQGLGLLGLDLYYAGQLRR